MGKVEDATNTMIRNLEEKTGRSMKDWVKVVEAAKLEKHGERVAFLKTKHGLGHGYANLVAHAVSGGGELSRGDDPVAEQYSGAKAALKPIYDDVLKAVKSFGSDVEVAPKKAYVSLRRSRQFAIVQPSTATRLDLGLNLKGVAAGGKLEPSGSFNAMVSHRVRLQTPADFDKEVRTWLKAAYDQA
jgi:hypothetical protein